MKISFTKIDDDNKKSKKVIDCKKIKTNHDGQLFVDGKLTLWFDRDCGAWATINSDGELDHDVYSNIVIEE